MTPEQIQAIAQAVADQQVHDRWWFYLLWLAVTLVAAAGGAWLGAFFKKRGENYATKQDFDELLQQVARTTETTTSIRSKIESMDWAEREWRTLRRQKAEEILREVHACTVRLGDEARRVVFSASRVIENPHPRAVSNLTALYFPELNDYAQALFQSSGNATMELLSVARRLLQAEQSGELALMQARIEIAPTATRVLEPVGENATRFEMALANIMANMAGLPNIYAIPPPAQVPPASAGATPPT